MGANRRDRTKGLDGKLDQSSAARPERCREKRSPTQLLLVVAAHIQMKTWVLSHAGSSGPSKPFGDSYCV